ncbi:phosphate ABC transporter permease subunit PstC [Trebonia sp.]|uniref:phosphate ABC transporter permease subunit PstC n=1 Tax=Trebonia sp. TaxID=2767075 RepID=UPI0026074E8F|nr:phosphate ABC transporter permease subunit PstC [Trebonia sp.]
MIPAVPEDSPRVIVARPSTGDKIFRGILRACGLSVFVITGLILVFLIIRALKAFKFMGFGFLTTQSWIVGSPQHFGIAAILPFGVLIALIAMVIAVPIGVGVALYISEYAPRRLQRPLISVVDLMAAIPSIIYGLWGLLFLEPRILGFESWLGRHVGWVPVFSFQLSPSLSSNYANSTFIAGVVVSLMVIPIITSLSRQVFSQAPQGEREGAYALGSTRWGMIRSVVLPFGRGGVIGATMLGLGRALGETIAVTLIIVPAFHFNYHVLESGGNSIAATIALDFSSFPDAGSMGLSALMAAGLVLFAMTLIVNMLGAVVIGRSRSGISTG